MNLILFIKEDYTLRPENDEFDFDGYQLTRTGIIRQLFLRSNIPHIKNNLRNSFFLFSFYEQYSYHYKGRQLVGTLCCNLRISTHGIEGLILKLIVVLNSTFSCQIIVNIM